ncbi:4-(cytidine 5'-diphospho)-2-C-methyl-D-erythritol kinase [Metarhizobium album]|uniref:4-diphosphocytidyl-2-C-methyl-D-erythritol kinase n=1 Tax=Metarhizobium album TaxID=2182425 RepID=A0A2U2DXQ5_9HYPH|nr:4-(cytidine 5'-diphospho)-2-C-methyl-D-erythritol kinase [Rhizobium album]PWE57999.1 4-(cytidine 5'-diphospho)-2-C-methyl-D-erythritol kinase [Rhizobium album]
MTTDSIIEPAPAKINLALHVIGQRPDGYHLMESVVTFAAAGDRLVMSPAATDRFGLSGRFAPLLQAEDPATNLVLKARDALRAAFVGKGLPTAAVDIHLEKNLPVASGIGGGSADAAAALRGLQRLWGHALAAEELHMLALKLGADVPMCLAGRPLLARGIGDEIESLPHLPAFSCVLVNPLKAVSTPAIFKLLTEKNNAPLAPLPSSAGRTAGWLSWLSSARNDLEAPAKNLVGEIGEAGKLLLRENAAMVRMSGSGATCFALFTDPGLAEKAAAALHAARPDWYVQTTETFAGTV